LTLEDERASFVFEDIPEQPVPSLLRDFSAPVKVKYRYAPAELAVLIAHDTDPYARWEAAQRLSQDCILERVAGVAAGKTMELPGELADAFGGLLDDRDADPALLAEALVLPTEEYLAEQMDMVDVDGIHAARRFVKAGLAGALSERFRQRYAELDDGQAYAKSPAAIARRSLKNVCLSYLAETDAGEALLRAQLEASDNMTDTLAAIRGMVFTDAAAADAALAQFEARWKDDPLVMDKWFGMQASKPGHDTVDRVRQLMEHPAFSIKNPNKVRSLIGVFAMLNPTGFHAPDGSGYQFLADRVIDLNAINPQVAARMVSAFNRWKRYDPGRRERLRRQLERIAAVEGLSPDVFEIVSNALK
jgi:aminopeptidase N